GRERKEAAAPQEGNAALDEPFTQLCAHLVGLHRRSRAIDEPIHNRLYVTTSHHTRPWWRIAMLCLTRNLSSEFSSTDTLLAVDLDPPASFVANHSGREYLLHWRPISLNPTTVMAAVAAGRDADLRKLEPRAATYLGDIEDCDGIVVRPPACRTPRLNDLLARLEDEIDAG